MKTDYLDRELNIGDEVVFMEIGYRNFRRGKILKMGEVKATIEFKKRDRLEKTFQEYDQLIKVV